MPQPTEFGEVSVTVMSEISRDIYNRLSDHVTEGSASPRQMTHLAKIALMSNAQRVGEVGFNTGHSASAFLQSSPDLHVTSFDIGEHDYIGQAKEHVDARYPGRHHLVIGDSGKTLPEYEGEPFDLLFIDGGHAYATAYRDIVNGRRVTSEGAIVVVDDLVPYRRSGFGPSLAWTRAVAAGLIAPHSVHFELPKSNTRKQTELTKNNTLGPKIGSLAGQIIRLKGWGVGEYK